MKILRLRRFNSSNGVLFLFSLVTINLFGLIVITSTFLGGISFPIRFHYSELEMTLRIAAAGLAISLFFSLLSLGVYYSFRRHLVSELTTPLKFFLIQLSFLFLAFIIAYLSVFYIIPVLRS